MLQFGQNLEVSFKHTGQSKVTSDFWLLNLSQLHKFIDSEDLRDYQLQSDIDSTACVIQNLCIEPNNVFD